MLCKHDLLKGKLFYSHFLVGEIMLSYKNLSDFLRGYWHVSAPPSLGYDALILWECEAKEAALSCYCVSWQLGEALASSSLVLRWGREGSSWRRDLEEGIQLRAGANEPRLECGQLWGEGGWGTMEEITVTVVGIRVRQRRVSGFQKLGRGSRL